MIWVHISVGAKLGQTTSASSLIWNNHSRRGGSRKCQVANLFHHLIAVLPGWMVVLVEILCPYPNYNYQLKTVLWGAHPTRIKWLKFHSSSLRGDTQERRRRWMAVVPHSSQHNTSSCGHLYQSLQLRNPSLGNNVNCRSLSATQLSETRERQSILSVELYWTNHQHRRQVG